MKLRLLWGISGAAFFGKTKKNESEGGENYGKWPLS